MYRYVDLSGEGEAYSPQGGLFCVFFLSFSFSFFCSFSSSFSSSFSFLHCTSPLFLFSLRLDGLEPWPWLGRAHNPPASYLALPHAMQPAPRVGSSPVQRNNNDPTASPNPLRRAFPHAQLLCCDGDGSGHGLHRGAQPQPQPQLHPQRQRQLLRGTRARRSARTAGSRPSKLPKVRASCPVCVRSGNGR